MRATALYGWWSDFLGGFYLNSRGLGLLFVTQHFYTTIPLLVKTLGRRPFTPEVALPLSPDVS